MSNTPRTDAAENAIRNGDYTPLLDESRRLEIELTAMTASYETSHRSRLHAENCLVAATAREQAMVDGLSPIIAERDALADLLKAGQRP